MLKGRSVQYVAAGLQDAPQTRMRVRSNVQLPDSEAGGVYEADRRPYHASQVRRAARKSMTVPLRGAVLFLCVLFVFFGVLTLSRASQRAALAKKITETQNAIIKTEKENRELTIQVSEARDRARIGAAAERLGMTAPSRDKMEAVTAPDTRPFEDKATAQAELSPDSAPGGMIAGSR